MFPALTCPPGKALRLAYCGAQPQAVGPQEAHNRTFPGERCRRLEERAPMNEQVASALISGLVALVVGGTTGALTWFQLRRDQNKWRVDLKSAWALELHKARLESYPEIFSTLLQLSHYSSPITREIASEVSRSLNTWFYSTGGMCADKTTRGAILGLRKCCSKWARTGSEPTDFYRWRNLTVALLRRDLDIAGLESYDFKPDATLLSTLEEELRSAPPRHWPSGTLPRRTRRER
ncbi:hypothetical protein GCM10009680_52450 [Streptomyces yatensis]|uniref:Uncharacterized protein n=2 Tax=Streptomyces yatensis TaxID=155177 RepID=A0ABN2IHE1_9ACTN